MKVTNRKGEELEVFGDIYKAPFTYSENRVKCGDVMMLIIGQGFSDWWRLRTEEGVYLDEETVNKVNDFLGQTICDLLNQQFEKK